jgi:hypothetical protein
VHSLPSGGNRYLNPGTTENIDRRNDFDLLESFGQDDQRVGSGHGVHSIPRHRPSHEHFHRNASLFRRRAANISAMAGVGKLLKTAQKMQRSIETLQTQLEAREIDVAAGGGAVRIKVNAAGKFLALTLDSEFLKEDPKLVSDTILAAVQDAGKQAKELNESEMQKVTSAFQMPGLF